MASPGFTQALNTLDSLLGKRDDPFPAYNFAVFIEERPAIKDIVKSSALAGARLLKGDLAGVSDAAQDLLTARCAECTGLQSSIETCTYSEGAMNDFQYVLGGPVRWPPLVLRRGVTDDLWWDWYEDVMNGKKARKSGTIVLKDGSGKYMLTWHFDDALPVKWTGPEFRAGSSAIAFESIELAHQGLSFQKNGSLLKG